MDLSIVIVNYNVYNDVKLCIESIVKTVNQLSFEIIVVDNNSIDRSIEHISADFKEVHFLPLTSNHGFAVANNIGMKAASGDTILLVNPDILFNDQAIETMFDFLIVEPSAGVVGPVQIKPGVGKEYYYTFFPSIYSRIMQEFGFYMTAPVMKYRFYRFLDENIAAGEPFKVDWVMGSCLMIRSDIVRKTLGFDESFFLYEEETEWQYRIRHLGWRSYIHPGAIVIHNHHSSASKLGIIFIHYQEFRSRIIFDIKRFKGIKLMLRRMLIVIALFTRIFYCYLNSFNNNTSKKKLNANIDLLKFSLRGKKQILNDKYDFNQKFCLFN